MILSLWMGRRRESEAEASCSRPAAHARVQGAPPACASSLGCTACLSQLPARLTASGQTPRSPLHFYLSPAPKREVTVEKVCPQPAGLPSLLCCSASPLPEGRKAASHLSLLLRPRAEGEAGRWLISSWPRDRALISQNPQGVFLPPGHTQILSKASALRVICMFKVCLCQCSWS